MNENERELESHATSLKHRIGKTMLLVGVIMVIIGIIASFKLSVMFYLLTLTSTEFQFTSASYYIESLFILAGFVMTMAGLIIHLVTYGFSKDGLWVFQMGPYIR